MDDDSHSEYNSGSNDDDNDDDYDDNDISDVHVQADDIIIHNATDKNDVEKSGTEFEESVASGDFGKVLKLMSQKALTDREMFFILKHHFVPHKDYNFPSRMFGKEKRHFQLSWLEKTG